MMTTTRRSEEKDNDSAQKEGFLLIKGRYGRERL
jgi:hypothetical protein